MITNKELIQQHVFVSTIGHAPIGGVRMDQDGLRFSSPCESDNGQSMAADMIQVVQSQTVCYELNSSLGSFWRC